MVRKYHYSNILPRINKHFVGFFLDDELVGMVTLGWGVRPKETIKKLFPSLDTAQYLEIGRMVMTNDMSRNSESQMLSQLVKYIKLQYPEIKVLFTWADGMVGKPGFVYQASNFWYAGFVETDMYLKDGIKIHPRQTKQFFAAGADDTRQTVRPTVKQMEQLGISHYKGRQFRYVFFTCDRREKKRLMQECLVSLTRDYPKAADLKWKVQVGERKWVECDKPPYITDMNRSTRDITNLEVVM